MTTYHIFFRNQYSEGTGDYTLYRDVPIVRDSADVSIPAWSNSFLTRNVPGDSSWTIDINDAPYAYCGTSKDKVLKGGDKINDTAHKLVKIIPQGNGSSVTLYNNIGYPAFKPDVFYTARPETFEIATENDFSGHFNFVAGSSGMDSDGRPRPLSTFKVDPNNQYYVKPNARFYLGDFSSQPGTLVDEIHLSLALIDFDAYPGLSNAIVTHKPDGMFEVRIVAAAVFAMETASIEPVAAAATAQLTQLKLQADIMSNLINTALGISVANTGVGRYECSLEWINNPTPFQKALIALLLEQLMVKLGYILVSVSIKPKLTIVFTHDPDIPLLLVSAHWRGSILALPPDLSKYQTNPKVRKILPGPMLASQSEIAVLPADVPAIPYPQWRCSVSWMEGPTEAFREAIAEKLTLSMFKRGYIAREKDNNEDKFDVDFFHFQPTNLETARADWLAAYIELGFVHQWVVNPQTETLFHPLDPAQSQTDSVTANGAPSSTAVPSKGRYMGLLQWLEGPGEQVKASIIGQLQSVLKQRGNEVGHTIDLIGADTLIIAFSHDQPSSLEQARIDWLSAFNSIKGNQRMYIFGPQCEEDTPVSIPEPPSKPSYLGCLTWLEGPNKDTRDSIIGQLKSTLRERGNEPREAIDFENFLVLPFSHDEPSSLAQARQDWLAAFNSIKGFQRMYITKPYCERDGPVGPNEAGAAANGTSTEPGQDAPSAPEAQPAEAQPVFEAQAPTMQASESIEEKKRRALELLQREGLIGVQGLSLA